MRNEHGAIEEAMNFWADMEKPGPGCVRVGDIDVTRGTRVRLHPRAGGDIMDLALAGRVAIVEGIDEDDEGRVHVAVAVEDDPGRDLGLDRQPGHRFYFKLDEIAPLPRILVAGIGNMFLGDDGFGSEVARQLAGLELPNGVDVRDFGIRGMDLAYALKDYDAVIFVDAVSRGGEPGTLYVIDADTDADGPAGIDTHGMDPVKVLALARTLGRLPRRVLVVGCEPAVLPDPAGNEIIGDLSAHVRAAIEPSVEQVRLLIAALLDYTND